MRWSEMRWSEMRWSEMRWVEACVLVLALLLTQCGCSIIPRVSFTLGSPGRALTSFHLQDVQNCTTLLLSPDHHTLYVGAQDAVLVLDIRHEHNISLIRKVQRQVAFLPHSQKVTGLIPG
ncbi:hypothetical protein NQD34_018147 [Periophthalmus magnuspinnatus]|nr:hypothetical protein NQD34_018147 [Periophthalmus magnuspinnatus]